VNVNRSFSLLTRNEDTAYYVHNMTLKNPELSYLLSKRDGIIAFLMAITLFLNSKLIVSEKSLKRMFEPIPCYLSVNRVFWVAVGCRKFLSELKTRRLPCFAPMPSGNATRSESCRKRCSSKGYELS
jgi:hypothetical protein